MKKLIAMTAALALLAGTSLSFAATSKVETMCKNKATKANISADKVDDYVKACVKKHHSHHSKKKKKAMSKTTPSTSSTPSSSSEPAPAGGTSTTPAQ